MRAYSPHQLVSDYRLLRRALAELDPDAYFPFRTPQECVAERRDLLEELRMDYAFKLLALLEARLKADFDAAIHGRKRDALSRAYRALRARQRHWVPKEARRSARPSDAVRLDDMLEVVRDSFRQRGKPFHRTCSAAKAYLPNFRNWYAHGRRRAMPMVPDPEDLLEAHEQFSRMVLGRA